MARFAQSGKEDDFPQCVVKSEREISLASTQVPSSPPLSRMVSPEHDKESCAHVECDEFELSGLPDEICESCHFEVVMKDIRAGCTRYPRGGLTDEISKSYQWQHKLASTAHEISKAVSDGCIPEGKEARGAEKQGKAPLLFAFGLGVIVRCLYVTATSHVVLVLMASVAAAVILPGVYLYAVDGCRPEDYEEEKHEATELRESCDFGESMDEIRSGRATYSVGGLADEVSKSSRQLQKLVVTDGVPNVISTVCNLGGNEDIVNVERSAMPLCLLAAFGLGTSIRYLCFLPISTVFFGLMAFVAALMVLPGIYLYTVDGCRPEDFEETITNEQRGAHEFGELRDFGKSMDEIRSGQATPPIGGLADEVYKSSRLLQKIVDTDEGLALLPTSRNSDGHEGPVATHLCFLVAFGLGVFVRYLYLLSMSNILIVSMVFVAALMILPGIYLCAVDGCRPEDYEETIINKNSEPSERHLLETCNSTESEEAMKTFRSVSATYPVGGLADDIRKSYLRLQKAVDAADIPHALSDGLRVDSRERHMSESQGAAPVRLLVAFGLGTITRHLCVLSISGVLLALMGFAAALIILPGIYLYVVDGCRPEDYEESIATRNSGASVFWLTALSLGSVYGMCISATFRLLMATVATLMLLPGIYLYMVDGCRPQDYED